MTMGRNRPERGPLTWFVVLLALCAAGCGESGNDRLMVGFNRRFAPLLREMKGAWGGRHGPVVVHYVVSAGKLEGDSWYRQADMHGTRFIGEGCHFVDLARYLVGAPITGAHATPLVEPTADHPIDSLMASLSFADGSAASIQYLSNGHRQFPKERVEVFGGGRTLVLDNFRTLTAYGWPGRGKKRSWRQDKGNRTCLEHFIDSVRRGQNAPIPAAEILEVSRTTLEIDAAASIAEATGAAVAGRIGRTALLYRPRDEDPEIELPAGSAGDET